MPGELVRAPALRSAQGILSRPPAAKKVTPPRRKREDTAAARRGTGTTPSSTATPNAAAARPNAAARTLAVLHHPVAPSRRQSRVEGSLSAPKVSVTKRPRSRSSSVTGGARPRLEESAPSGAQDCYSEAGGHSGLSLLERRAVRLATARSYQRLYAELIQYCRVRHLPLESREDAEEAMLDWADSQFLEGRPGSDGLKMLAAYTHHHPERGRFGVPLARVRRACQSWKRLAPCHARVPPAFPMICGVVVELKRVGREDMALAALIATSAYLRPGELLGLRGLDVVAPMAQFGPAYRHWSLVLGPASRPAARPTKTGVYDDAVILDHEELQWINPLLSVQVAEHPGETLLWDFDELEFKREFVAAARRAGLQRIGLVPYSLRHAGPSWDALLRRRPLIEVQRRGRWANVVSVQRYERSSRVVSVLQNLPKKVLGYLRDCEARLSSYVLGVERLPAPPIM